jgi:2-keto-3-deoxy-L-fuconate dehydrogenase
MTRPRIVIVTEAAGGIGTEIARTFRDHGDTVVEVDLATGTDIRDPEVCNRLADETVQRHRRIDVLCNNAGIGAVGDIVTATVDSWQRVFDVNVFGLANLTAAVIPTMRAQQAGAIVNTCSIAADIGLPERVVYSASKGAVLALTRAVAADELRHGIRVNCVSPTTVDGPWVQRLIEASADPVAARAALEARQPMGELARAADIAAAVLYLASPDARMTGQELRVDAGVTTVLNQPNGHRSACESSSD